MSIQQRAVVIGTGMISDVHRRAILLSGAELLGVIGSSTERTVAAATRWATRPIGNLAEAAAAGATVAHICTPNSTHERLAVEALGSGLDVVVEKPVATDVPAVMRIAAAADATGKRVAVPFVYRFHPIVREIRDRLTSGALGRVALVHGSYLQDWLLAQAAGNWRVDDSLGGRSRAVADIGSHWFDMVEFVTGDPVVRVSARLTRMWNERPETSAATFSQHMSTPGDMVPVTTEDAGTILFETRGGVVGTTVISQVSAGRKNRLWFEADATKGSVAFDQENAEHAWWGDEDGSRLVVRDPSRGSGDQARLSYLPAGHAQGYDACFEAFVADAYRWFSAEDVDGVPHLADGLHSARLVAAIMDSAETMAWREVVG